MNKTVSKTLSIAFFLSGFCGLLYQVVWLRMAFASFGITTGVISVIISTFMAGLTIGSWLGGKYVQKLSLVFKTNPIVLYAIVEIIIGIGAFAVPVLFGWGEKSLLPVGNTDSGAYLLWSALVIAFSILPWCLCMGTTFPFVMAYMKQRDPSQSSSFSYLYLANVLGAMTGVFVTALILIESLGFGKTLFIAGLCNFSIGALAIWLNGQKLPISSPDKLPVNFVQTSSEFIKSSFVPPFGKAILFVTGFASMGMEVAWTRAFTPITRTTVYAFAAILFIYLLATWLGSRLYRKHLNQGKNISTHLLVALTAVSSLLPILLTDPRLKLRGIGIIISLLPFCALLGYLTPKLIDRISKGNADSAGTAYAINVLGCILGPLVTSYFLLPQLGVKLTLIILALPLFLFQALYFVKFPKQYKFQFLSGATILLAVIAAVFSRTYEEQFQIDSNALVLRDHVATVVNVGEGLDKRMLVNGVGITHLTPVTKQMAHLPLAFLATPPQSALVICFGMGTTFRSLLSWNIQTTAVELVPSVKESFGYYHGDAIEVLNNPNGHIVIDDGRRYLKRSTAAYDVITLDPPPPVEASGSSLLYSQEFYDLVKLHLKPGGVLQQWFPGGEAKILAAVMNSLTASFPYIKVFDSYGERGFHFIASMQEIPTPTVEQMLSRMPESAKKDLMEWYPNHTVEHIVKEILVHETTVADVFSRWPNLSDVKAQIRDDRPYNEYFALRRAAAALAR